MTPAKFKQYSEGRQTYGLREGQQVGYNMHANTCCKHLCRFNPACASIHIVHVEPSNMHQPPCNKRRNNTPNTKEKKTKETHQTPRKKKLNTKEKRQTKHQGKNKHQRMEDQGREKRQGTSSSFCKDTQSRPEHVNFRALSGPVLRDTARLSQRYPPIARYGVFGVSTWPIGCDTPSPFSECFSLGEHVKWRCDTHPQKGYLSDTCAIPYENKANGVRYPPLRYYLERVLRDVGGYLALGR